MGVSHSPLQLAAKMVAASVAIGAATVTGVEAGAVAFKEAALVAAPRNLKGVGKNGARLDVKYHGGKYPTGAKFLVYATGPWQLIESDTDKHQIPRQRSSASFEGVFGHAVIPGGDEGGVHGPRGVRTRVQHPGTKGKHPWRNTEVKMAPLIPVAIEKGVVTSLVSIF